MSIQSEIDRIRGNVNASLRAVAEKGVNVQESDGSNELPSLIASIQTGGIYVVQIDVITPPNKTEYFTGEVFDPAGMVVEATYSNGAKLVATGYAVEPSGPLSDGMTSVTIRYTEGGRSVTTTQAVTVTAASVHIYGVTWDGSSTTALTRTDDSALFTDPVPAVGTGAGSSPFDNCLPWSGMTKVTDGNNTLVKIPKFWVKVTHSPFKVQIADQATDGFQVSPAHRDRGDGVGERDVVYIGRYECNSSYQSMTGQSPKVDTSLSSFRSGIKALGTGYYQADYALQLTLFYLYLVEFADWNGQSKIGRGNVDSGAVTNTGGTDSMTYHTGRASGTDGNVAIQYRYIENLWGNVREWRDGIIFSAANMCTYNNPENFVDTYNGTGATVRSNTRSVSSGWITAWGYDTTDNSFIYPSAVGGSETTYIPDYCNYNYGVRALFVSGGYNIGSSAGPFYLGSVDPSSTYSNLGSRLQKLPQAA